MFGLIAKKNIQIHIDRAVERTRRIDKKHHEEAIAKLEEKHDEIYQRQHDEFQSTIDSLERQISALKSDAQKKQKEFELVKIGVRGINRTSADIALWAERFMGNGIEAFREIQQICGDTDLLQRKLEGRKKA